MDDITEKFVTLGPRTKKKVLILDMDETMMHASFMPPGTEPRREDSDFVINLSNNDGSSNMVISIKVRPNLYDCLIHLSRMYEIVVFTAGEQTYADAVLDYIDEEKKCIQHRLYR